MILKISYKFTLHYKMFRWRPSRSSSSLKCLIQVYTHGWSNIKFFAAIILISGVIEKLQFVVQLHGRHKVNYCRKCYFLEDFQPTTLVEVLRRSTYFSSTVGLCSPCTALTMWRKSNCVRIRRQTTYYNAVFYLTKWTFPDDGGGRQQNML